MLCRQSHFHDEINEINHIKNTHTQNTKHVCGVQRTLAISINARKIKNISYKLCFLFLFFYIFPFFFFFVYIQYFFSCKFFFLLFFLARKNNFQILIQLLITFEVSNSTIQKKKKRDRKKYMDLTFFFWKNNFPMHLNKSFLVSC